MPRLFVALDLTEEAVLAISRICSAADRIIRWVPPSQLHLTLRFIGSVDENLFARLRQVLAGVAAEPCELLLQRVGHFPPKGDPKILWIGVALNQPLLNLRSKIDRTLATCGVDPEARRFFPHVTIARLKSVPAGEVARFIGQNRTFAVAPFTVSCFHLYSSVLTTSGATHVREQTYPLGRA